MQTQRKKASPEKVEHLRRIRQLRNASPSPVVRSRAKPSRQVASERDHRIAARLCRRFYRGQVPDPLSFDIRGELRYWKLRKFGYDVLSKELRTIGWNGDDPILCDPRDTREWKWWAGYLDHGDRESLLEQCPNRLLSASVEASNILALHQKFVAAKL